MKNYLHRIIILVAALLACGEISAYDFEVDGIYYNKLSDNTCEVTSGDSKYSGSVSIPTSVNYENIKYAVTSIGDNAFSGCSGLTSITISSNVTSIRTAAFSGCIGLTSITIPGNVNSIKDWAFSSCSALTSVTIENGVISIGNCAFYVCSGITSITIPSSVTSIGRDAFFNCFGITSIKVENGNTVYDSRDNCNAIIETASNTLIKGCDNTVIPNSVTSIEYAAFHICSGLASITIPNCLTSIANAAFGGCSGLTSITIPSSVTSVGYVAFSDCSGLTSVKVEDENTVYDSRDNCNAIIETASNTLIQGCKKTVIPISVTGIGESAFSGCTGLTSVAIPSSVASIGNYAFFNCSGLTSIKVEEGNTVYDSRDNCNAIIETASNTLINGCENTVIPNSVTSIEEFAFHGCSGLTSVTIPSSVTSIGSYVFYYCTGLNSVTNLATTPQTLGYDVFENIASNATLHVLPGCKATYEAADQWNNFIIVEDADDPTEINGATVEIEKTDNIYSLSGQKLSAPIKGINIINGKKILVK